jgi:hypothetical protein
MARATARFTDSPIGPGLVATDGGLLLSTTATPATISRTARSDIGHSSGTHGAEFVFWGDADQIAAVGLVTAAASLSAAVGAAAGGVGWRLDEGKVYVGGAEVTSGLTVPAKGQIVGVRLRTVGASVFCDFYRQSTLVYTATITAGTWYFAASLAAPLPGDLVCAVNAGQWPALSDCARAGWREPEYAVGTVRVANANYMTAPTDTPANTRYEAALVGAIETIAEVGFWPWEIAVSPRGGAAQASVLVDRVDLSEVVEGLNVALHDVAPRAALSSAAARGRFVLDGIEAERDGRSRLRLRDPHDALDEPVNPGVFLPSVPALAWQQQPFIVGAVCSAPMLAANSDATVGFLADGPVAAVDAVMDRGDLLEPGTFSIAGGNQLFLDSPPQQPVLVDLSTVGAAMAPAPLEDALHAIYSAQGFAAWSSADAAAIDSETGYAGVGFYAAQRMSVRQARDEVLANYAAAAYADATGVLRLARLVDPDTLGPDVELDAALLVGDLVPKPDFAPNLTRRMYYQTNVQRMGASDFVTDQVDVPADRRQALMAPGRGMAYYAGPLAPRYTAAERRAAFVSGFYQAADAQAELDRVCGLYTVERAFWTWTMRGDRAVALVQGLAPGAAVLATYPRHGLESGRSLLVVGLRCSAGDGRVTLKLWG